MSSFMEQANRTPLTYVILLVYVTMALVTDPLNPTMDQLDAYGMSSADRIASGEPWRLLTYAFLHGGLLHLVLNSYFLIVIGPMLEQLLGTTRFAVVYVVSALGGGIAATLWSPGFPIVGGSGALFGMLGTVLALNMRQGRHFLDFMSYHGPRQIVVLIVLNLVIGMVVPIISNSGHIGGLIAGFALTFCFLVRGRDRPDAISRAIQGGWVAVFVAAIFYCLWPVARSDYHWRRLIDAQRAEDVDTARQHFDALKLCNDAVKPFIVGDPEKAEYLSQIESWIRRKR